MNTNKNNTVAIDKYRDSRLVPGAGANAGSIFGTRYRRVSEKEIKMPIEKRKSWVCRGYANAGWCALKISPPAASLEHRRLLLSHSLLFFFCFRLLLLPQDPLVFLSSSSGHAFLTRRCHDFRTMASIYMSHLYTNLYIYKNISI